MTADPSKAETAADRPEVTPVDLPAPEGDTADAPVAAPEAAPSDTPPDPAPPLWRHRSSDGPTEPVPDPQPDPDPVPPVPSPPPLDPATPPRAGIGRAVLGGAVGAALVIGLGVGVARMRPDLLPLAPATDRISALETRLEALADPARDAALDQRIEALAARIPGPAPDLAPLQAELTALREELAALRDRPAEATADLDALRAELAAMKADLARQPGEALAAEFEALKAAAATERAEAEARAGALRAEAEATARAGVARAAVLRVRAALDSGAELTPLLDDLTAAGLTVPPALAAQAQGIPTLAALQTDFPGAARAALAAVTDPADHAGWGDRVTAFLKTQTGLRSLTPREGDDPDAVLSRAEAALATGDLPATLAELDRLPDPARAALSDWYARAEARAAATRAIAGLIQQ